MPSAGRAAPTAAEVALAHALDQRRREVGMSQATLADLVGVSQPQVSKMLAGRKPITMTEMVYLCDALGLVLSDFLRTHGL